MSAFRLQPPKNYQHAAHDEQRPIAFGANFHDDPLCRSTNRKSHTLGLDTALPKDYAPHTQYNFTGVPNDFSWLYQTSATAYGGSYSGVGSQGGAAAAPSTPVDAPVLRFLAYTREIILESNVERTRIRKMGIVFHTQDNSIAIREARQPNSGLLQGQVLLRQRVPRSPDNVNDVLSVDDFSVGGSLTIFGQTYYIVDCDERTRKYFKEVLQRPVPDIALPWPTEDDTYNTKVHQGLQFKAKKLIPTPIMDQKRVVEQLTSGIISKHPPDEVHSAQQFLENKINEHLQFAALWDDRSKKSGDLRLCAIRYFLENDTIEVIEIRKDNCGREGGNKLLCRQRIHRDGTEVPLHSAQQNTYGVILKQDFLEAKDIHIGETLRIHKRDFLVYDADHFTRNFMRERYGTELPPPVDVTEIIQRGKIDLPLQYPPPHDGYGTEEDSIQNWKYLSLKPPKVDMAKVEKETGRVMIFAATFAPPVSPEDQGRRFVICFYRATDEVEIIESSVRNSGVIAGKFLSKRRHLKPLPDGRKVPYSPEDFEVGKPVTIMSRTFLLTDMDRRSERIVRGIADPITEDRIRELIIAFKVLLQSKYLRMHEAYRQLAPNGTGLTIRELREFFKSSSFPISEDEALYLVQNIAPNGNGVIGFDAFIQAMDVPNSDNMDVTSINPRSVHSVNMALDSTLSHATRTASDRSQMRSLRQQLVDKLNQRRATVQEVFRMLAGQNTNGKLNRLQFAQSLRELLHFNVTPKEHALLVGMVFDGVEDANGDINVKQFHAFLQDS